MAGHSQWSNIKFRKEKQDAKKNKIFTKFSREIYLYAKGDPDPKSNPSLRNAILQAKSNEVPNHVIDKSIRKAIDRGQQGEEVIYECVQGNYAFIVIANTDNKTRTSAEVKEVLKKNNASIGKCSYLFEQVYMIKIPVSEIEDSVLSICTKLEEQEDSYLLFFSREDASMAYDLLRELLIFAKFIFRPVDLMEMNAEGENIINELEELDDVYQVFSNISEVF
jgi:YebC/PmpR family DNA-binding regulatory protein